MQLVDPARDGKLGCRHGSRFVVEIAAVEPQQLRLPHQRQIMVPVDHRFALARRLCRAHRPKNSTSSVSSPILGSSPRTSLGVQHLHIHRRRSLDVRSAGTEYPGNTVHHLRPPGRDLVRVYVILLRQLGQRLLALDCGQRHLVLECQRMSSGVLVSSWHLTIRGILAASRQKFYLSTCPDLASHL